MASSRPSLSITLPAAFDFHLDAAGQMPKTPEAQQQDTTQSTVEPPPPPRPQPFKVKRKRPSAPLPDPVMLDAAVIPTIEMSEVPSQMSSPTMHPTSAHLLSPVPMSATFSRALTPPKTPAPKVFSSFSQLESPVADEWDLINNTKPTFQRTGSVCSSFSDSSLSSCGSSAFSMPTGGYDSPEAEAMDPFVDDELTRQQDKSMRLMEPLESPRNKRPKTRRHVNWTPQMDDHLWMTFMAYLSDPTLTPFKMLPGSTPPMGVCDQVATKAKRTWRARKLATLPSSSIDAMLDSPSQQEQQGSPDTIRPNSLQAQQLRWPKAAATRRRLRELCARRPSISAHYQRMLRTRSPSPFESSSPANGPVQASSSSFSGYDMVKSLVTSTAPSMQPDGVLARLASEQPPPAPKPSRPARPEGWFDRIPRSKAHQKSASLQSELKIFVENTDARPAIALESPFDVDMASNRNHLLQSMAQTKSLGRTAFNGKSLDSPFDFKAGGGAPTDRRSRKRRFRSDEEKPRRPALEDVFGPPIQQEPVGRNRGFSVGAVRATDNLTRLFSPPAPAVDHDMLDVPNITEPFGSRSAPRRLAEPVPRLASPFMETPPQSRQHNTFPRASLLPTMTNQEPFHQRLLELASQHSSGGASKQ